MSLKNKLWVKVVSIDDTVLLDEACYMWENDGNALRFHLIEKDQVTQTILIPLHRVKFLSSCEIKEG